MDVQFVLFYWVISGSMLALILPDLVAPLPSGDCVIYFTSLILPFFVITHLVLNRGLRPSPGSYRLAHYPFSRLHHPRDNKAVV